MEDNFDPETGECEGGMRNISGDDDDDDADVAFGPLIRTRDERKGVERRRTDGRTERHQLACGQNTRRRRAADSALLLSHTLAARTVARNIE